MSGQVSCLSQSMSARRCLAAALVLLAGLAASLIGFGVALAQQGTTPVQRSYINPFPNGDRYRVVVIGDSLGDGLWSGLYRAFEDDATIDFIQKSKPSTGFSRSSGATSGASSKRCGSSRS